MATIKNDTKILELKKKIEDKKKELEGAKKRVHQLESELGHYKG